MPGFKGLSVVSTVLLASVGVSWLTVKDALCAPVLKYKIWTAEMGVMRHDLLYVYVY